MKQPLQTFEKRIKLSRKMSFMAGVVPNSTGTPIWLVTFRMFSLAPSEMNPLSSVKA